MNNHKLYDIEPRIKSMGSISVPDVDYGDLKLQVMPFNNERAFKLPIAFSVWQSTFDELRSKIPLSSGLNNHHISIESRYFFLDDYLRREGLHIDGNFCLDDEFSYGENGEYRCGWGARPGWLYKSDKGGMVGVEEFELPYSGMPIEQGKYVSSKLGGLVVLSKYAGCNVYTDKIANAFVGPGGDLEHYRSQLLKPKLIAADEVFFMTGDTPHESLKITKGNRRAFLRITLNHRYPNRLI